MVRYRIDQIKLGLDEAEEAFEAKIRKSVAKSRRNLAKEFRIENIRVLKKSIDARDRNGDGVKWVYSLAFDSDARLNLPLHQDAEYHIPRIGERLEGKTSNGHGDTEIAPPIVIGFGPCGIFAALVLARAGLKPIVLERGEDVDSRTKAVEEFWSTGKLNPESNVQFGEGGAGTFSDGKLNTGIKDPRIAFVLKTFADAGADKNILIDGRPHVGTDVLKTVVKNLREEIISLGGQVRFGAKVEEIEIEEGRVKRLKIKKAGGEETINPGKVILAIGHSARDTFRMLKDENLSMEPKAFSMGVRVEHDQKLIDSGIYGKSAGHPNLPPAYYKLSYRGEDGRGVYSFCMCPGGEIVNAASQEEGVVTNGMSNQRRDSGKANSGILVDVRPEDYGTGDPLSGMYYQEKYERLAFVNGGHNYSLPETTWKDFGEAVKKDSNQSCNPVVDSLPDFVVGDIADAMPFFGKRIPGFDGDEVRMVGIESRSSSPVRILRDPETLEGKWKDKTVKGFYPAGEGAGYAGGITSAAVDGIKIAEKIICDLLGEDIEFIK